MPTDQLIAFVVFAIVGSFTPGPNNTIATVTSANFGFRAVVPLMLGVPFGFSAMLAAGSAGVAAVIVATPWLAGAIKWGGIAYLAWIAWQMMRPSTLGDRALSRPFTFWQAAAFQLANPKAWMLAAATAGAYMSGDNVAIRTAIICAVFSLACAASLVLWAGLGDALSEWLRHGARLRAFNAAMGASLAATAAWLAFTV